jgi:hypothetical protein
VNKTEQKNNQRKEVDEEDSQRYNPFDQVKKEKRGLLTK